MQSNKEKSGGRAAEPKPERSLEEINAAHIRHTDKFFRNIEGAASNLTGFHAGFIYLEIRVDDRLRAPLQALARNIANSWRREKELSGAVAYCASIYRCARWSGYLLEEKATEQEKQHAIRRMKEPANEPDVFLKIIEEEYGFGNSREVIQIM